MRTLPLFLVLSSALLAQNGAETEASLINRVRASAATYTEHLQDFFCLEHLVRYTASAGPKQRWKRLEHQELEVTYTKEVPHYRLLSVNGKTDKLEKRIKHGYFLPGGEFGALAWVFDSRARPDLLFDHRETTAAGRAICVFRYRIPLERTNIMLNVDDLEKVRLGHSGLVHTDCNSTAVLRVEIVTDPGAAYSDRVPVGMTLDVYYEPARVGDKEFLLPHHAVLTGLFNKTLTRADIEFSDYRKYISDSTITFDPVAPRP